MTVVVLVGVPGSGKSTWADGQSAPVLSSDEMRRILTGDATNQQVNRLIFRMMRRCLEAMQHANVERVVVDSTALTKRERRTWVRWAELHGCPIEAVYFDTPAEVCQARNVKRDRVVPKDAMARLLSRLEPPSSEEGFDRLTTISAPSTKAGRGRG
jgi:predicted kinase